MSTEQRAHLLASRAAYLRAESDAIGPRHWLDPLGIALRRRAAELELLASAAHPGEPQRRVA